MPINYSECYLKEKKISTTIKNIVLTYPVPHKPCSCCVHECMCSCYIRVHVVFIIQCNNFYLLNVYNFFLRIRRAGYIHIWKWLIGIVHASHVVYVRVFGFSLNNFISILVVFQYRRDVF